MEQGQPLLPSRVHSSFADMETERTVTFHMEPELCQSAQAGQHNFIGKIVNVLTQAGLNVDYAPFGVRDVPTGKGWTMSHIKTPVDSRGLCFRRVYHYPFWQIERSGERWSWDIAQSAYEPDPADAKKAAWFYDFWQKRLFGQAPKRTSKEGFIYVPLQGKISSHRPFQICSPLDMVEHCLTRTNKQVITTLHPNEHYDKAELSALKRLEKVHPQLSVQAGGMEDLLVRCDYIVTQNSSVAFNGYFFGKPALLFRKADFHHIAVQAKLDDLAAGFEAVQSWSPDYAAYVFWFWQKNSINAGRPEADDMIAARLRTLGWPV
jgi:hypothetical protein